MLKIALIGAPTSGKSQLAQQLVTALHPRSATIVDDYIDKIEQRSDVALSHYATYLGNMQAAIGRFEAERLALKSGADVRITCGTLVESAIYTATLAYTDAQAFADPAFRMASDGRAALTMQYLGLMRIDTFDYDLVFYLPLESEEQWNKVVDDHIAEAAESFNVKYTELPTAPDARLSVVLQEILSLETSTPNEQSSGDSSEEGEEVGG